MKSVFVSDFGEYEISPATLKKFGVEFPYNRRSKKQRECVKRMNVVLKSVVEYFWILGKDIKTL